MSKLNPITLSSVVCLVSILSACSSDPASIGEKQPQYTKSELAAYAATWDGYAEAYEFEDGSDRVRLMLDEQGNGTLRFGNRDLIGPATSPTEYYPPQTSADQWGVVPLWKFWSGYEYAARDTHVESERIRLNASVAELFASYCALQTPYPHAQSQSGYRCLPYYHLDVNVANHTTTPGACIVPATTTNSGWTQGDPVVEINCEQMMMCNRGCTCTATACSAETSYPGLSMDAALDDSQVNLVGTLLIGEQRITIRLQRQ